MKKRTFLSIFIVAFLTLILTTGFIIITTYKASSKDIKSEVKIEAEYVALAIETLDNDTEIKEYLNKIGNATSNRITLIELDGAVIYDNYAKIDEMENHSDRVEVKAAIKEGSGEVVRASDTIGKETYYYALKVNDTYILRVANDNTSVIGVLGSVLGTILIETIFICILVIIVAYMLSGSLIKPVNSLDLDNPLLNDTYEELTPLLANLEKKNKKIEKQIEESKKHQNEFEYITSNMNDGLLMFSNKGKVIFANKSVKRILGNKCEGNYLEICRNSDSRLPSGYGCPQACAG